MPFVYGRPVRIKEFLGRESELLAIFNRLRHKESTAIVGEPHIGKTSLLLQIGESSNQEYYLADDSKKFITVFIDLQPIGSEYKPTDFWKDALEPLHDKPGHGSIKNRLNQASTEEYSISSLRRLFRHISEMGQVLVLLLDEFDRLLGHPNFKEPSFYAGLRSLSTITGGLVIITSSKLTVAQMNTRGHELLGGNVETSPFFNNFIEIKLRPFSHETAVQLLERAPKAFTEEEVLFIRRIAGCHPYLLQAMAATLYENTKVGEEKQIEAAQEFFKRISFHFDTLWLALDDKARTTAVILSLMDLGGSALGNSYSYTEIENAAAFDAELHKLADLGLAEKIRDGWKILDIKHGLLWNGEQWTISTQAFTWWVRDVVISKSRKLPEYDEWLADKRYRFLLTEQQWNALRELARKSPESLVAGVNFFVKIIIRQITGF